MSQAETIAAMARRTNKIGHSVFILQLAVVVTAVVAEVKIGVSCHPFYPVVVDVHMLVDPLIITLETYLSNFLVTLNTLNYD